MRIIGLLTVFMFTLTIIWYPWIKETVKDPSTENGIKSVLTRIFPVWRGLFQSEVATFWYFINLFIPMESFISQEKLILTSTAMTLAASLPACIILLRNPSGKNFILSQFSVSLAFFIFSFHVHEKQILCPLLFIGLAFHEIKHFFSIFVFIANFSMVTLYVVEREDWLSFYVPTFVYLYFIKQLEACALNSFRTN
jgi:alpha-1,3-glucosyltransferase